MRGGGAQRAPPPCHPARMGADPIRRDEFEAVTGTVLDALRSQGEHDAALGARRPVRGDR